MRSLWIFRSRRAAFLLAVVLLAGVLLSACGALPDSSGVIVVTQPSVPTSVVVRPAKVPDLTGACTVARGSFPTPNAAESNLVKPVSADDWVKGPASARLVFIEYGDYQ